MSKQRSLWSLSSSAAPVAAMGLLALSLVNVGPAIAETRILFNKFPPPPSPTNTQVINPWLKEIERVTEGRVKIVTPDQSLAAPPEQVNMVRNGVADGAFQMNGFLEKSHPLLQISFLPGTMRSGKADAVALWRTYEKFFAPKDPFSEVKLLGFFASPPGYIYNMEKKPIQSLAELKGKKAWSLPGVTARAMGLTGASVVPGPAVRMYEIVSKGVVDAFCCVDYADLNAFKVLQYLGAATEVEGAVFSPKFSVFVNKAKWAQIAPKDQAAILAISGEALARRSAGIDQVADDNRKQYLAQGGIIVAATPAFNADLKKAWQPLIEQWIAEANALGVDGRAALDFYLAEADKVAAGN